jgi:30S ribosomal protein S31
MGKGDKRSFKGKVFKGSFGKSRPRSKKKTTHSTGTPVGGTAASQKKR